MFHFVRIQDIEPGSFGAIVFDPNIDETVGKPHVPSVMYLPALLLLFGDIVGISRRFGVSLGVFHRSYADRNQMWPDEPLKPGIGMRHFLESCFFHIMLPEDCDAIVGDLEERYRLIHKNFGQRRANCWYWKETLRSMWPLVWACAKKVALKPVIGVINWAVGKGLFGDDSWLAALVELYQKIRS
jgi:hypothetical protein